MPPFALWMEGDNHDVDERDDADETTTMGGATPAWTGPGGMTRTSSHIVLGQQGVRSGVQEQRHRDRGTGSLAPVPMGDDTEPSRECRCHGGIVP